MSHSFLEKPQFIAEIRLEIYVLLYPHSQWGKNKWIAIDVAAQVCEIPVLPFDFLAAPRLSSYPTFWVLLLP